MEWALIVGWLFSYGAALTTVPMETQAACEAAAKTLAESKLNGTFKNVYTACVRTR